MLGSIIVEIADICEATYLLSEKQEQLQTLKIKIKHWVYTKHQEEFLDDK